MNYYEHHIGDFDSATAHLSLAEDAVYRRLISLYYRSEAPIPADLKMAARLVRAASKPDAAVVESVLLEFFELREDGWHNKRCDEEIARYRAKSEKARSSVNARWNRSKAASGEAYERTTNVERTYYERNTTDAKTYPERMTNVIHRAPVPSLQTPVTIHSEAIASGAAAPPTARDMVFANGVTLLTAAGVADKNARSFLAAQCKAHGEGIVLSALERCASERPIQPIPWLQATLAQHQPAKSRHSGFESKNYREGINADGSLT